MKEQSERLGKDPIPRLLADLAIPAIVGMLVMATHSVIDTIYIARGVGTVGVAAVAIAFPLHMFFMALSGAIGIGGASVISRALGAGNLQKANEAFGNINSLVITVSVVGALLGLSFLTPMLILFGSSATILPYARDYLGIILYGTIFFAYSFAVNNIVRAEGNARMAMTTMIMSSILNAIFTPIFMFVLDMGIQGAAYGTVLAQGLTALYLFLYFQTGKSSLSVRIHYLAPQPKLIGEILSIGASAFVRQGSGSIMLIVANNMLILYGGDIAIAVLGIIHRVIMFTLMPILGVVQGMLPLVGFNYGAKNKLRVNETIVLAMKVATAIALFAFILVMSIPGPLIKIFTDDPEAIEMGRSALRIIFALSLTVGVQMITGGVFQALGKARSAFIVSMTRQIIFLIPLLLLLPFLFDLRGIWLAFPLADLLSFILVIWLIRQHKNYFFPDKQNLAASSE
ncbi:MAG: MATE family efflux transporter [Bacillota bacterium]|nr:MATE family efflux transporter [Bacillota bacterium]